MSEFDTSHSGLNGSPSGRSLLKIPETPADFLPPKTASLTAVMGELLRDPEEYADIKPYLDAIAGVGPSIKGSARLDESACIFLVEGFCKNNGYALLEPLNAAHISRVFKVAFKGNTGLSFKALARQGRQLRLEHKRVAE